MKLIKVDSLRVRINMRDVKIVDAGLYDEFAKLNLTTGEIIKEKQVGPIRKMAIKDGYKHEMTIRRFQIGGITDNYLVIILNAKMLREKYFEGLSHQNIKDVYEEFINQKWVSFSYGDFLKSSCTDIDFCLDYMADKINYQEHLKSFYDSTPLSKERERGFKRYKDGAEWNNRATATSSHPFLKIYDKEQELWNKSGVFTEKYLKDDEVVNRKRLEFTVKNGNHLKDFNISDNTLGFILSTSQVQRFGMLRRILGKVFNFNPSVQFRNDSEELKPDKEVLLRAMRFMYGNGMSKEASIAYLITNLNANNKYKYRKKLDDLWENKIDRVYVEWDNDIRGFLGCH